MSDAITLSSSAAAPRRLAWQNLGASALRDDPELRERWDGLNRARADLPFLCADAVCAALAEFGTGRERLLVGRDASRTPAAMALLAPQGRGRWSTFQPSQIPLGAWVAQAALRPAGLGASLLRGALPAALSLTFTQIDPRFAPREADSDHSEHADYVETGWIDVQGRFEDYWAARGKNLRQNLRKQRNRLAAEGVNARMRVWREPQDMAGALARYGALESAGWKAAEGTAVHPDNAQGRFYLRLMQDAARRGEARVHEYWLDERCVAANLCLLRRGVLVVLKTAYDESIPSLSPAFLLREEELQAIFREGEVQRIEYYGRLMEWHTRLTGERRMLHHLTVYRWPLLKRLAQWRRPAGPVDEAASPSVKA